MRRFNRDLPLYLLLALVLVFTFGALQRVDQGPSYTYSQIRTLFLQERVSEFRVKDNVLTMTVRGEGDARSTIRYHLADFRVFYNDLHEVIADQNARGIITDYDYDAGWVEPPWFAYLPYVLLVAAMIGFWYMTFQRQNTGGGGGGGASRFGHARTKTLSDQNVRVTFDDVAGADEEKEELREIVDFMRDPQKYTALGARIPKGVLLVGPPGTGKTLIAKA